VVSRRFALAAMALVVSIGCAGGPESMRVQAPPDDYAKAVEASRADKDRQFLVDPDSPIPAGLRNAFRGLQYWPLDPRFRLAGPLEVFESQERFTIVTTAGQSRPCERYGRLSFELQGVPLRLTVYRLLDGRRTGTAADLFVPFMDATTGKETYPAGRYVNLEEEGRGRYVLDFNLAYNPSCAYGAPERFQCPRTPAENRLPVAIQAGERGWQEGEAAVGSL
jgi:uncharacterized protein (DUF1684 family)